MLSRCSDGDDVFLLGDSTACFVRKSVTLRWYLSILRAIKLFLYSPSWNFFCSLFRMFWLKILGTFILVCDSLWHTDVIKSVLDFYESRRWSMLESNVLANAGKYACCLLFCVFYLLKRFGGELLTFSRIPFEYCVSKLPLAMKCSRSLLKLSLLFFDNWVPWMSWMLGKSRLGLFLFMEPLSRFL